MSPCFKAALVALAAAREAADLAAARASLAAMQGGRGERVMTDLA
jgi:hypothetical protein